MHWKKIKDTEYKFELNNLAFYCWVTQIQWHGSKIKPDNVGLWEIHMNLWFASRDKKLFFSTPEKAMEAAEVLMKKVCTIVLQRIKENEEERANEQLRIKQD